VSLLLFELVLGLLRLYAQLLSLKFGFESGLLLHQVARGSDWGFRSQSVYSDRGFGEEGLAGLFVCVFFRGF
jgi:hypothetical protein